MLDSFSPSSCEVPQPLSTKLHRLHSSIFRLKELAGAYTEIVELWEVYLIFGCGYGFSMLTHLDTLSLNTKNTLESFINKPLSIGDYLALWKHIGPLIKQSSLDARFQNYSDILTGDFAPHLEKYPALRNKTKGHGWTPPESDIAQAFVEEHLNTFLNLLHNSTWLWQDLAVIQQLESKRTPTR